MTLNKPYPAKPGAPSPTSGQPLGHSTMKRRGQGEVLYRLREKFPGVRLLPEGTVLRTDQAGAVALVAGRCSEES